MNDPKTYRPLGDTERTVIAGWRTELDRVGEAVGAWETKSEVRPKGVTLWLKFDNSVDVLGVSARVVTILLEAAPS